ncbi:MAG: PAS domain S-box protein [Syntrophobacteraceae bacterium]|nr:PAS domain S-box protein [Syntrophobacteraceae bacterium]
MVKVSAGDSRKGGTSTVSLRRKTLIIFGATFLALLAVCYAAVHSLMMSGFLRHEARDTIQNVERVQEVISDGLVNLDSRVWDWANWDDLYAFAADANKDFIDTNLTDRTFIELKLGMILIFDSSPNIVFARGFDPARRSELPLSEDFKAALTRGNPFLWHDSAASSVTGLMETPHGIMLAASRPILTSEGSGRIRGALVMGVLLDEEKIRYMSRETRLDIAIENLSPLRGDLPGDFREAMDGMSEAHPVAVRILSEDQVAGYAVLKDVAGKPVAMVKVVLPREIHHQGKQTQRYLAASLLLIGIVHCGATLLLMERYVLARVIGIIRRVERIGRGTRAGERLPVSGRDEISTLGLAINGMVEALEISRDQLRHVNEELELRVMERTRELDRANDSLRGEILERLKVEESLRRSEASYRDLFLNAPVGIFQASPDGRLMKVNPALATMFGYAREEDLIDVAGQAALQLPAGPSGSQALPHGGSGCNGHFQLEGHYLRKDGSPMVADVQGRAARDDDGRVIWLEGFVLDITERRNLEESLLQSRDRLELLVQERTEELSRKTVDLEEANAALKALLRQRDLDRAEYEESILSNVRSLIFPSIEKLRRSRLSQEQAVCLDMLESQMDRITSPFVKRLSEPFLGLTPTEIQVADLIRAGQSTKEIADILCLSESTVLFHRNNLRGKLGLKGRKTNLRTHLQSLS